VRTEIQLHSLFWGDMQKSVRNAQQAINDARPLIVKLRELSDEDSGDHYLANAWLEDHGE